MRLAKRWVGAHLLSPHLSEHAVELLVAHCFASGGRSSDASSAGGGGTAPTAVASPPASRLSGLLRFLQLLAEHPWRVQPLVVDPNGELAPAQRDTIARRHAAARAQGALPAALCLATPRDQAGGAWTAGRPNAVVLPRIAVLAQRSAAALEALVLGSGSSTAARGASYGTARARRRGGGGGGSHTAEAAATAAAAAGQRQQARRGWLRTCRPSDLGVYLTVSCVDWLLALPTRSRTAPWLTHTLQAGGQAGRQAGRQGKGRCRRAGSGPRERQQHGGWVGAAFGATARNTPNSAQHTRHARAPQAGAESGKPWWAAEQLRGGRRAAAAAADGLALSCARRPCSDSCWVCHA